MTLNTPALLLSAALALSSCQATAPGAAEEAPNAARVTLQEAEVLVRAKVFELKPTMNPDMQFPLREILVDGLWKRLGCQLFQVTSGVQESATYLVRHGEAYSLCGGLGGHGIQSACVTDLDGNAEAELTYTWSWGSGIHRSLIAVCRVEQGELIQEQPAVAYRGDIFVKKESDAAVTVEIGTYEWAFGKWTPIAKLGELKVAPDGEGLGVGVTLSERSEEHTEKVWVDES